MASEVEGGGLSNFTAHKINRTTFAVREDDAYKEHPLIYVKIHQKAPIIVLSDTGTDEVSEAHRNGRFDRRCRTWDSALLSS